MVHNSNSYPIQYVEPVVLRDGTVVQLRPIHKKDGKKIRKAKKKVSTDSLYQRFLGYVNIDDKMIKRFTDLDYSKEMAIVAEVKIGEEKQIIGVARVAGYDVNDAEFAIIITDEWQGKGLGSVMTNFILEIVKDLDYKKINAFVFSNNKGMLKILKLKGFEQRSEEDGLVKTELVFSGANSKGSNSWFHDYIEDIN